MTDQTTVANLAAAYGERMSWEGVAPRPIDHEQCLLFSLPDGSLLEIGPEGEWSHGATGEGDGGHQWNVPGHDFAGLAERLARLYGEVATA